MRHDTCGYVNEDTKNFEVGWTVFNLDWIRLDYNVIHIGYKLYRIDRYYQMNVMLYRRYVSGNGKRQEDSSQDTQ